MSEDTCEPTRYGERDGALPPTASNNLLRNALIAYWPGDEASGDLIDAHTNGLDLTDNNTVTNAAGKVYATARQYTAVNTEYHETADDDLLDGAAVAVDMTVAAWVYLDTNAAAMSILSKEEILDDGYNVSYNIPASPNLFRFNVDGFAGGSAFVTATTFGAASTDTWYLVVAWHDSVADTLNIQVNNGTVDSAAWANGIADSSVAFKIGAIFTGGTNPWNGRIGPVMIWKSAAGGGGVLTAVQRAWLYNGGLGLAYSEFED